MNCSHSQIIDYIIASSDGEKPTYEEIKSLMAELGIRVKFDGDLAIFNYKGTDVDFSNPVVQEARGIIIDLYNWRVVCWPFRKFGNYHESYADNIDWETAQIQEKIDGSIVKLWRYCGHWNWSTNACIDAADATIGDSSKTFLDLIHSAANYDDIDYLKLDETKTYIFELVSPDNKVVVDYPYPYLYHIGTRSNLTGVEYDLDIGIEHPRVYSFAHDDIESVLKKVEVLNTDDVEHEGFVVRDANYNRVKVKNSKYLELHYTLTKKALSKKKVVEALLYNDEEFIAAIQQCSNLVVAFKFYDWQVTKLIYDVDQYINICRGIFLSLGENRKDFALKIKNDKFKSFAFTAIDRIEDDALTILRNAGTSRVLKYIDDMD